MRASLELNAYVEMVLIVAVIFLMVAGASVFAAVRCHVQWAESGFQSQYKLGAGCLVRKPDGTWIPASTLREVLK